MNTSSKILMGITGAMFIALGILCICHPGATLLSASLIIGILTLISGISTIGMWIRMKYFLPTGNLLLSGIFQVLVGIIFLSNNFFVAAVLPVVFAVWILAEGVIFAIRSFDFKKYGFGYWWVVLIVGVALAVLGFFSLRYPVDVAAPMLSYVIGGFIILFGVVDFVALFGLSKVEKAIEAPFAKMNNEIPE